MKKLLFLFIIHVISINLFAQKDKKGSEKSLFLIDALNIKDICKEKIQSVHFHYQISKDTVLFCVSCGVNSPEYYFALMDIKNNKIISYKKGENNLYKLADNYKLRNNRLINIGKERFNQEGDFNIVVKEFNPRTSEVKTIFDTHEDFPKGIDFGDKYRLEIKEIEYLFDSNIFLGSYRYESEKERKYFDDAFIIDCKNKKLKIFKNHQFSYEPGTQHPYKFFIRQENNSVPKYEILDFKSYSLTDNFEYNSEEWAALSKKFTSPFVKSKYESNIAYTVESGNDSLPTVYYSIDHPINTNSAFRLKGNDVDKFYANNLIALLTLIKKGKTQYTSLMTKNLLNFNQISSVPLFYLPDEKKFLCRDTSYFRSSLIDKSYIIVDVEKKNETINQYTLNSIKQFKEELKPSNVNKNIGVSDLLSGFEKNEVVKTFTSYSANNSYLGSVIVYKDYIDISFDHYKLPFKGIKQAYLIGNDSLVVANDLRCVLFSVSKKEILMDIDLEKMNTSYTPFYLTLSGGGRYIGIYNNILNYASLVQLFPFKIIDNLPAVKDIEKIIVSENGNIVLINNKFNNQVVKFDRTNSNISIINMTIHAFTDDLSYLSENGYKILTVYNMNENTQKRFQLYDYDKDFKHMFKLDNDKVLLDAANILVWSEDAIYTPNLNPENIKFGCDGYNYQHKKISVKNNASRTDFWIYSISDDYKKIITNDKIAINYMLSEDAIEIRNKADQERKKKFEEQLKIKEQMAKDKEIIDAIKAELACDACFGEPINKNGKCSYNRCRNGYVYGETNTMRYDDKGYIEYKNTKSTEKCYLCKGTGYWVCEKCEGTGVSKKKRK